MSQIVATDPRCHVMEQGFSKPPCPSPGGSVGDSKSTSVPAQTWGLLGALLVLLVLPACPERPLTVERAADRIAHGQLVTDRTKVCMIQESLMLQPGIPVTYAGKTYHQCCAGCAARFMQDPARYSKARDPVSGADVDKADAYLYAREGRVFFFQTLENVMAFDRDPQSHLRVPRPHAEPMPGAMGGGAAGSPEQSSTQPAPPGGEPQEMGATELPTKGSPD
ncbi:MAG: hypothetical protein HYY13_02340 [Nitrospirae bacterium]|nr:hypothetical protein [Nitrospirota bacterium]